MAKTIARTDDIIKASSKIVQLHTQAIKVNRYDILAQVTPANENEYELFLDVPQVPVPKQN